MEYASKISLALHCLIGLAEAPQDLREKPHATHLLYHTAIVPSSYIRLAQDTLLLEMEDKMAPSLFYVQKLITLAA